MAHRALLLVDLQNDFCAGGALAVPEGDSTVDVANALIDWSLARGEPIVASQDWHPADHGSFASQHQVEPYTEGELDGLAQTFWPDHCVQHSEGAAASWAGRCWRSRKKKKTGRAGRVSCSACCAVCCCSLFSAAAGSSSVGDAGGDLLHGPTFHGMPPGYFHGAAGRHFRRAGRGIYSPPNGIEKQV